IHRFRNDIDGGDVLMRGAVPTKPTYAQNLAQIYKKPNIFMHRFLENLGKTRTLPQILPESPYAYKLYTTPSLRAVALYQVKTFITITRKLFNILSGRDYRFGVAYQSVENWQSSVLCRSNIIANPPYRFLADPFVFRRGDLDLCFVEDYDFRTKKGKIS